MTDEQQDITNEVMDQTPLPIVEGMSDKSKNYDYYKKIFTDPELVGLDYIKVQDLYNKGEIKAQKFKSLVGKLDRYATSMKEVMDIVKYTDDPNTLKNPYNTDDRRKVDISYAMGEHLNVGNVLDDDKIINKVSKYGGIIPQQISRQFGALISNGTPEQQLHAAQLISKLDRVNPNIRTKNFPSELLTRADYINLLNYEGANIKEIIKTVNEFTKPLDIVAKDSYRKEAREYINNQEGNIKRDLRNSSVGVSTRRMIDTYKNIYESVYRGNHDYAKAITLKNIEGRFSPSAFGVDAKTVMETAPEEIAKIYDIPDGKQEEYVRQDFQKFMDPHGALVWDHAGPISSLLHGTTFDNKIRVYLEEDAQTDLDHSYAVKYIDRGMPVPFMVNKQPLRYQVTKPPQEVKKVVSPHG